MKNTREALEWYRDEAAALAKHLQSGAHSQAVLASLTVLSLDAGRRASAALEEIATAAPKVDPGALSDERIDAIADLVARGMPDGILGFCKTWGWRQFSRALLQDCRGYYADAAAPAQAAPVAWRVPFEGHSRSHWQPGTPSAETVKYWRDQGIELEQQGRSLLRGLAIELDSLLRAHESQGDGTVSTKAVRAAVEPYLLRAAPQPLGGDEIACPEAQPTLLREILPILERLGRHCAPLTARVRAALNNTGE